MNILNTLAPVGAPNGSAVALGYFDGVHLGTAVCWGQRWNTPRPTA